MTDVIRLDPHDPLPEASPCALVIRRFGEDDPNAIITELDFFGAHPTMTLVTGPGGAQVDWETVLLRARDEAAQRGLDCLYAVDRTAGTREQEVIAHHGDHSTGSAALSDTDPEDNELGSGLRDRTTNAGYFR